MNILARVSALSRIPLEKKIFVSLLLWALSFESFPQKLLAYQGAQLPKGTAEAPRYMRWQAERLEQFVALIALYPDSLASVHAEQQKKTTRDPQAKWQVGTVTAVQPYKVPNADPSITSYKVSVKVGNIGYVVLNTPRPGTDIGIYARGRQVPVLVGEHTITYNDRSGNSFQVPILSHTTVTPRESR